MVTLVVGGNAHDGISPDAHTRLARIGLRTRIAVVARCTIFFTKTILNIRLLHLVGHDVLIVDHFARIVGQATGTGENEKGSDCQKETMTHDGPPIGLGESTSNVVEPKVPKRCR